MSVNSCIMISTKAYGIKHMVFKTMMPFKYENTHKQCYISSLIFNIYPSSPPPLPPSLPPYTHTYRVRWSTRSNMAALITPQTMGLPLYSITLLPRRMSVSQWQWTGTPRELLLPSKTRYYMASVKHVSVL